MEFTHRDDIARFAAEHPDWDGVCWVGPVGGIDQLEHAMRRASTQVEMWRLDTRVVEGRRPADVAGFALHRASICGVGAVGGARQLAIDAFPDAGRGVLAAAEVAARRGDLGRVWVCSAAWRAGLLRPEEASSLLSTQGVAPARMVFVGLGPELLVEAFTGLTAKERMAVLAEIADPWADPASWAILAAHSSDPALLARIATDPEMPAAAVCSAVDNPAFPDDTRWSVASQQDPMFLAALRSSTQTPPALLDALFASGALGTRSVPPLVELSEDAWWAAFDASDHDNVRADLGACQHAPVELLEALWERARAPQFGDGRSHLGKALARNPSCPTGLLVELAVEFPAAVAENPSCPTGLLVELAGSDDSLTAQRAVRNEAATREVFEAAIAADWTGLVLQQENCPWDMVEEIVERTPEFRADALMERRGLPDSWVDDAIASGDPDLLSAVSSNWDLSSSQIDRLIGMGDVDVLDELGRHADRWSVEDRQRLRVAARAARRPSPVGAPMGAVSTHCRSWADVQALLDGPSGAEVALLRDVAALPDCPPALLAELVVHPRWAVRMQALFRPDTPIDAVAAAVRMDVSNPAMSSELGPLLERLTNGGHVDVAAALAGTTRHTDQVLQAAAATGGALPIPARAVRARLTEAAAANDAAVGRPAGGVRSLDDLAGGKHLEFDWTESQQEAMGRLAALRVPDGDRTLRVEVLRSAASLTANANFMGNCTGSYQRGIENGETLLLAAVDERTGETVYNVELETDRDGWMVGEVNSRFNHGSDGSGELVAALKRAGFPGLRPLFG